VHEALYGERTWEVFAGPSAADPMPTELAAGAALGDAPRAQDAPATTAAPGRWASVATRRPAAAPSPAGAAGTPSGAGEARRRAIVVPQEAWLPSTAHADCFRWYPDPL